VPTALLVGGGANTSTSEHGRREPIQSNFTVEKNRMRLDSSSEYEDRFAKLFNFRKLRLAGRQLLA